MSSEKMPNWLHKRSELTPERIALRSEDEQYTFAQLNEGSKKMAQRLARLGVKENDHVALLMNNNICTVEIIHGLEYLGAVMVLLNTRLTSFELTWQLKDSKTTFLIYDGDYEETVAVVVLGNHALQVAAVDQLLALKGKDAPLKYEIALEQLHTIIYTSGTTGNPKGVMLTYGNHWWSAVASALNLGLHNNDCWLLCVPVFHVSGLSILMRSVIYGISVDIHEAFDPVKVNKAIKHNQISIISVVGVMLTRMLGELIDLSYPDTLRCVLLGGGSVPQSLLQQSKKGNIPVFQTYGMTETASQIATLGPDYLTSKLGSAGKALFPAQLKIIKDEKEQGAGEVGEIVVKGPNVTKGYYGNQQETSKTIKDGWLYTGDMGYKDEDGFLYVLDRRSDLIISGGENVYPAEIESVILMHPAVEDAGVAGRYDEKWGKAAVAFVKVKGNQKVTEEELREFCRMKLAGYKVPAAFNFVDELPRNAANKLLRRKLWK
ncbi:MAG: o-succinylbenzoate--CoA ligase [Erysipelothrix sp.]|nr:o-succinylbenzoate--CoA ligase [Erysipelothrix sp.]